jgi:lipoic acid synthetase
MDVLRYMKETGQRRTKSGIMLGLGETKEEVIETIYDLKEAKVDVVTIGQYLQPSKKHLQVQRFVTPEEFLEYKDLGEKLGFKHFESSALVRSSYRARKHIQ